MNDRPPSTFSLLAIPVIFTWIVLVLRLVGELNGWPEEYFGTAPGGGGSLVGISWLIFIFGFWFGLRLSRTGSGPMHRGVALIMPLLGNGLMFAGFYLLANVLEFEFLTTAAILPVIMILACLLVLKGWPALFRVTLVYGLLSRIPVVIITYLAVPRQWDTHFEKLGPDNIQMEDDMAKAFWLSLAQIGVWVPFTILAGGLLGGIAALLFGRRQAA